MRRAVRALVIVAAVGVLAGCDDTVDDLTKGGSMRAFVQRDANVPCRLIITPLQGRRGSDALTALLEGCEAPKRADRLAPEVRP